MKHSTQPEVERPFSPARQAWLMLVVVAPMAAFYPAIKTGLEFAPSLRFAGLRTLVGGLALLLMIRRKQLWPEARLARWMLPLGLVATTLTFGAMFASPAYTGVTAMGGFGERLNAFQGGDVALILLAVALSVFASRYGRISPAEQSSGWEALGRTAATGKSSVADRFAKACQDRNRTMNQDQSNRALNKPTPPTGSAGTAAFAHKKSVKR